MYNMLSTVFCSFSTQLSSQSEPCTFLHLLGNPHSQKTRSGDHGGQAVGKWRLIILSFPKCRFNSCFTGVAMCGGVHNNCAIYTSTLLQCWNELVSQKRFITCPIDCTGYRTRRTNLLGKERANDKCCRKPAPHSDLLRMKRQWLHLERILSCPYSAILSIDRTLEMEMGFTCQQNVPWPCIVHFHSSKKLHAEASTWIIFFSFQELRFFPLG
ncbi:hypothetical protein AVEN_264852-1 [Araneus ventricosus]|uniref:Uncharacterized protein n=1 Tax=Araneus ventricosus TaxID=182803 RepID=A0A4Y2L225_ARAVE|nr:hypothetical protein AVEN_264852-1 [Araneus ventricosus]